MEYFDFDGAALKDHNHSDRRIAGKLESANDLPCGKLDLNEEQLHQYIPTAGGDPVPFDRANVSKDGGEKPQALNFYCPTDPCDNCWLSGLQCLVFRGGQHECSSCTALSQTCSFIPTHGFGLLPIHQDSQTDNRRTARSTRTQQKRTRSRPRRSSPIRYPARCPRRLRSELQMVEDEDIDREIIQNMNPLERWKYSPPESEPATISDIARAITHTSLPVTPVKSSSNLADPEIDQPYSSLPKVASTFSVFAASSIVRPGDGSTDSDLSQNSSHSSHSCRSVESLARLERHHSRRRRSRCNPGNPRPPNSELWPSRRFECTFCPDTFRTRFDWCRHENTQHVSLESWICSPRGIQALTQRLPASQSPKTSHEKQHDEELCCVFCLKPSPDLEHYLTIHSTAQCPSPQEPVSARTFYRKDHLAQHLRLVHKCTFQLSTMASWRVQNTDTKSRCGFCGTMFKTWEQRTKHLAQHFRAGARMTDWIGDYGLDAKVNQNLERLDASARRRISDARTKTSTDAEIERGTDFATTDRHSRLGCDISTTIGLEADLEDGIFVFESFGLT